MAGMFTHGTCIDYHDGEGYAVVNGRQYRWDFHEYCGPLFLRKDGEPLKRQPGEHHPVWDVFNKWHILYIEKRKSAKSSEIVRITQEELK